MAPGYPFLVMLPFQAMRWIVSQFVEIPEDSAFSSWWQTSSLRGDVIGSGPLESEISQISWTALFQNHDLILLQHLISLSALFCGFLLVRKYFGFATALIFAFLYGMSPLSLQWPSCSLPEWIQGTCLVFWLFVADRAKEAEFQKKLLLYAFLGIIGSLAFLIKFNSLPVILALFGGLIFWEYAPIKQTFWKVSVSAVSAFCTIWFFTSVYHRPTTGTSTLTMNSWPLGDKVFLFLPQAPLPPDLSLPAKQILALCKNLPYDEKIYSPASYFRHMQANDKERETYRSNLNWVLQSGTKEMDSYLKENGFEPIYRHDPLLSIAYFIGLREYSDLVKNLYLSSIRKYPLHFVQDTLQAFFKDFSLKDKSYQFHPLYSEVQAGRDLNKPGHFGFVKFKWPKERFVCYHENAVWLPGAWVFTQWEALWPPTWCLWFCAFISFIAACKNIQSKRKGNAHLVIFLFVGALLFVFFSNAIWIFRLKEFELIRSLITILAASGLVQLFLAGRMFLNFLFYQWKIKKIRAAYE